MGTSSTQVSPLGARRWLGSVFPVSDCPLQGATTLLSSLYLQCCLQLSFISAKLASWRSWLVSDVLCIKEHQLGPPPHSAARTVSCHSTTFSVPQTLWATCYECSLGLLAPLKNPNTVHTADSHTAGSKLLSHGWDKLVQSSDEHVQMPPTSPYA